MSHRCSWNVEFVQHALKRAAKSSREKSPDKARNEKTVALEFAQDTRAELALFVLQAAGARSALLPAAHHTAIVVTFVGVT